MEKGLTKGTGQQDFSRAEFLKGVGAAAGAVAVGTVLTGCSTKESSATYDADIVVVGSGNGGLCAAVAAAKKGAKVIVLEISKTTGGGSAFSGGLIHAMGTRAVEDYLAYTQGMHDPILGPIYFKNFLEYLAWLKDIGAAVSETAFFPENPAAIAMGDKPDMGIPGCRIYFDSLVKLLQDAGGTILMETRGMKILTDDSGKITALRAKDKDGTFDIKAKAVVLACGGFQANSELRSKYLGPYADMATILAVPYNRGDGMKMAQEVGASLQGSMGTFSAVLMGAYPYSNKLEDEADYESRDYTTEGKYELSYQAWHFLPDQAVLVNLQGKRFVAENSREYRLPQAMIRQLHATGVYILDSEAWEGWAKARDGLYGYSPVERLEIAKKYGAVVFQADTVAELADKLAEPPFRVEKGNLLRTIDEWNAACMVGTTDALDVPFIPAVNAYGVKNTVKPIAQGPFYAWPCTPAIYCNYGGVAIDENSQVLDMQRRPIPGLYAAAPTAGGIFREIYTGGIGLAGTTGWVAGNQAAQALASL